MAARDRRDRVRVGERRDRQDRVEAQVQDEGDLLRRREGLRPHPAGSAQEEHGHVRPVVADTLCKALPESPGVVLREQGEGPGGVHHGAHRVHRVQGGQGPEDHIHFPPQRQRTPHRTLTSGINFKSFLNLYLFCLP